MAENKVTYRWVVGVLVTAVFLLAAAVGNHLQTQITAVETDERASHERLARIEERQEAIDRRLSRIEEKLDTVLGLWGRTR